MRVLKGLTGWLVAAGAIVAAMFAASRIQSARTAAKKADNNARYLEANEQNIDSAVQKASVHRAKAVEHAARAERIKTVHQTRMKALESKRGSNRAADLAARLGRL